MTDMDFQVVIAVHNLERDIVRSVQSVFKNKAETGAIVVSHNTPASLIKEKLEHVPQQDRIYILELMDHIPSPATPFNLGISKVTAPYFSVLGSDDELEAGAIDAWLKIAELTNSKAVVPQQKFATGKKIYTPITRPWRSKNLDPLKDRLSYRTAQLGLLSSAHFKELRFTEGLRTGEDIVYGLKVWFSGHRISYARNLPGYLVHDTLTSDRVSVANKAPEILLEFCRALTEDLWFQNLPDKSKLAIVIKLLRTNILDAISTWLTENTLHTAQNLDLVNKRVSHILSAAPNALNYLNKAEAFVYKNILEAGFDYAQAQKILADLKSSGIVSKVLPNSLLNILERESSTRYILSYFLQRFY